VPAPRLDRDSITRRQLVGAAAAAAATAGLPGAALAAARPARRWGLPTPQQVRRDFQRMVDFGPRLTATAAHGCYIDWLEQEFARAGLHLAKDKTYTTDRWVARDWGLDLLEGPGEGPVKVATYYPRSKQTPADGIEGPLVYGGAAPAPSISSSSGPADITAAIASYPDELAAWASSLPGTVGGVEGSILLVDLPMPVPLTAGAFTPISTYLYWPGHTEADWAKSDYKRIWIMPGLGVPLNSFAAQGAAGVVFITDASSEALDGAYAPFTHGFEDVPALYVDRDTGDALRRRAGARPKARLRLSGTRRKADTPSVTAVLPGRSDETLIFNTHTDGQGFAEENGGVAFVHLARHFASLPKGKRLDRTLVFAAWPGHMVADLPQTQGWIDAHPGLVKRAAAALTVEHLGCTEWNDVDGAGYKPTGDPELFGIWTTQGKMFELTRDSVVKHDIQRAALLRPPAQFGVGAAFQSAGVPQIGAIAGPEYLITVSDNGDMDKLDEHLAARQIAWLADLAAQIDKVPADVLRKGDPTLGGPGA
jgi:hypothetical protein